MSYNCNFKAWDWSPDHVRGKAGPHPQPGKLSWQDKAKEIISLHYVILAPHHTSMAGAIFVI